MIIIDVEQGTDDWFQARLGKVTASRVADVMARTKTGYGADRANYAAQLIVERLTGQKQETYTNAAMQRGAEQEPQARELYGFMQDVIVQQVGLVMHQTIDGACASPDGLVGDDGLVEIKCPTSKTHIETLLGASIDGKYIKQMQWQMACTGRAWCDFVSFDDRLPGEMQIHIRRVHRDDKLIAEMEGEVRKFLAEIDAQVAQLRGLYQLEAAA